MTFSRRCLMAGAACSVALPQLSFGASRLGASKTFDVTTRVQLKNVDAPAQLWLPLPSIHREWQELVTDAFSSNGKARIAIDVKTGVRMLHVDFARVSGTPMAEVISRLRTRDRLDVLGDSRGAREAGPELRRWLEPTEMVPIDGIVRTTALKVITGAHTELDKARAIYNWVIANAHREPRVRGCGEGNVREMLESGDLSGKCVDLNSLFVALCRAIGLPARDVFGLRLAPSATGYRQLGADSGRLDGAQHCRAEVYLKAHGWVPADPADVAKVMRQETQTWIKSISHPLITPVYGRLFGSWEGNWLAWNDAHDVRLPHSKVGAVNFLMYPVAEIGGELIDSYAPAEFAYSISACEVAA